MTAQDARTGADLVADALVSYGVRHAFGNPGTTELPLVEAITDRDACEYVMATHEDVAVGMAAGYAKIRTYHAHHDDAVTPTGFVNLHAAPGLAHGLGNIHGSQFSGAPVVVTAGIQGTDFRHEEPILSGTLVEMTRQFTKWSATVSDVDALPTMLRRAFRRALTPPTGPVFLGLPLDVVQAKTDARLEPLGPIPDVSRGDRAQIERAAELLASADDPVVVLGDYVARSGPDAVEAAVELAEATGSRVYGEIMTAEVNFPCDHDQWRSFIPPNEEAARASMDSDAVALVGCSTNTTILHHERPLVPSDATVIAVGPDADEIGKNNALDAAVVGDVGAIATELAADADARLGDDEQRRRRESARERTSSTETESGTDDTANESLSKEALIDTLYDIAPDASIVDESVTTKYVLLDRWPLQPGQFLGTKGGGLGYGLPAAVGAAFAERLRPTDRSVVGLVGDGSLLYYPTALYTAARYDVNLTVVVPNNRSYGVLKDNTVSLLSEDHETHDFDAMGIKLSPAVDFPGLAAAQGVNGETVSEVSDLHTVLERSLETSGPRLVDVLVHE